MAGEKCRRHHQPEPPVGAEVGQAVGGVVEIDQPHLQPFYGEPTSLVYYVRAADVRWSIVSGRVVMRDGEIPGLDTGSLLADVKARAPHLGAMMRDLGGASRLPPCPCGMHPSPR